MKRSELDECVALTSDILGYLVGNVPPSAATGITGAQLKADVGALNANAPEWIPSGLYAKALVACFYDAIAAGISLAAMSSVRSQILALTPVSAPAVLVVQLAEYYSLVMESKIIAATTFVSSNQVDSILKQMAGEFDTAIESAADVSDASVFQALIALQAALVNMLVSSAYSLPRVVNYTAGKSLPSLVLAQMLYADASRADELAMENNSFNPTFMPITGIALSE